MKCLKCSKTQVLSGFCKEHFILYFEAKVKKTILSFKLFSLKDKIVVAASGGKDSTSILFVLHKLGYDVTALAIDEGIAGYRNSTLTDLKRFCKKHQIPLKIVSFEKEFGLTLDKMIKKLDSVKPCTICGVMRRYLLNKHSSGFDKIVTGHNLDDEAQSIFMNILHNKLEILARLGPITGLNKDKKFVERVKPLYLLTEREVAAYSFLRGFNIRFTECPYAVTSFRAFIRDKLNALEQKNIRLKEGIVSYYLGILKDLKAHYRINKDIMYCDLCSEPSKQKICKTCQLISKIRG